MLAVLKEETTTTVTCVRIQEFEILRFDVAAVLLGVFG